MNGALLANQGESMSVDYFANSLSLTRIEGDKRRIMFNLHSITGR